MTISNELLDELLKGCKRPEDLLGDAGLMKELKVRLMERMLGAELTAHLGYDAGAEPPPDQTNRRNGVATKRVKGSDGEVPLSVPRDREGSFGECPAFCVSVIWSMLPERSKDNDDFKRTAGRVAEGLQAT